MLSEHVRLKDKLRFYDGTCYPVVSDAWGCCLTSCGVPAAVMTCFGADISACSHQDPPC